MYYAKIDESNIVTDVICADYDFVHSLPGNWIVTDYEGISPINYAGVGYMWRSDLNGFVPPQPYNSWTLNHDTCQWEPPVAYPQDDNRYTWDETSESWVTRG